MLTGRVWNILAKVLSLVTTVLLGSLYVVTKQKNRAKHKADVANEKLKLRKAISAREKEITKSRDEARQKTQETLHEADKRDPTDRPDGDFR